jgi:hypothetical protein
MPDRVKQGDDLIVGKKRWLSGGRLWDVQVIDHNWKLPE